MNINEISLKLDFPKELLDAMDGKEAIIAGGSVLRRLLRVPTEGTDIDVFFYGSVGAGHLAQVALALIDAGYTTRSSINELRVLNPNKWPTTPQRVEKYCATFGLRVVDNL